MNWNTTQTGTLYHSFENGQAVCNSRIKDTGFACNAFKTIEQVRERIATWRVGSLRNGLKVCGKCEAKEAAAAARAEASMAPQSVDGWANGSTPSGIADQETPTKTHHYNALGGQKYIAGRGWVNRCRVCQEPEGQGDHFHNPRKEAHVSIKDGPLTPRQAAIVGHIAAGMRHKEIARKLGTTLGVVRTETQNITRKYGAETSTQALAMHSRAEAYLSAAELLEADAPQLLDNGDDVDSHVAHVLMGLAKILRDRATALLPG